MKRAEYAILAAIIALALAGFGLAAGGARAQTPTSVPTVIPAAGQPEARTITVSGHGEVQVQPDQAIVQIGVQNDSDTASNALQANSQAMQKALNAIKSAGVAATDVQTQQVSLQPRYSTPGQQGGTPTVTGYTAANTVSVRVRDLSKLGSLIDAAVAAGGNQIQGIQFVVSDPSKSAAQAREAAWRDAMTKAQQLSGLAGASLGEALNITETGQQRPIPFAAAAAAPQAAQVPVEPGTQTVSADLQVTWALGPGTGAAPAGMPTASGTLVAPAATAATPASQIVTAVPVRGTQTPALPLATATP